MAQATSYETVKLRIINGQPGLSDLIKKLKSEMVSLAKELPMGTDGPAKELQEMAQQANEAIRVAMESENLRKDVDDTIEANVLVSKLRKRLALLKKPEGSDMVAWLKSQMVELKKKLPAGEDGLVKELQELAKQADETIAEAVKSEKQSRDTDNTNKALELVNQLKKKLALVPGNFGYRTGKTDGELVEGWNAKTQKNEFHHPEEWERLIERDGGGQMVGGATKMINLKKQTAKFSLDKNTGKLTQAPLQDTGVFTEGHDHKFIGTYETHIRWERESTVGMRKGMTDNVNNRDGESKKGVENNCDMADKLSGVIKAHPDLLAQGGLLSRIAGKVVGQGQHDVNPGAMNAEDVEKVIKDINEASKRLKEGKGQEGDANKIMQLIGCFTDGLTEVLEFKNADQSKKMASDQFDAMWPTFKDAFGLEDGDKDKLLQRVEGFKAIAGGVADTNSGKGTRKSRTRIGEMPDDPRYRISDEDALIKNDISGSMHSSLLAQELSESLIGGKPIKGKGDSVQVKDKGLIDARAYDALSLTAGGADLSKGGADFVMHTAYEMINGMRAITGGPEVDEAGASFIIRQMGKGVSFTDAMEALFKPEQLPWLSVVIGGGKDDSGSKRGLDLLDKLKKQMSACEYRLSKEMDGSKYRPTEILDLVSYTSSEISEFQKSIEKVADTDKKKLNEQLVGVRELQQLFVLSAMQRAVETLEKQRAATVGEAERIVNALKQSPDEPSKKELYRSANKALVEIDEQIHDWVTQIVEGAKLPGIDTLQDPLDEMAVTQNSLEEAMISLLPTLKGKPAKDDGTTTIIVPENLVIKDDKDAERILIECKDWSEAKKLYAQYKPEMQKLANFRQKVVDAWLNANLRDKYGLKKAADEGWVSVGSNDPTSDYDISINKHSFHEDGTIRKYDYEMVEEFNEHFRSIYQCETGTIFDTNLYASAPPLKLEPREDEGPEEKNARENIKKSNDIGALMKQRRYMSGAEFNDYMVSVLQGIPEDKQYEVANRFQQADDNYRISLQKTVAVLVKDVEKTLKKLEAVDGNETVVKELKELLKREKDIRSGSGSDFIGGTDELEHLAHDLEHACKDSNTQSTNILYAEATKDARAVEGKITGLQACMKIAEAVQKVAKAMAELPQTASVEEKVKLTNSFDELKSELAKAIEALNDSRLRDVPKAIEENRMDDAASALAKLSPELYEDLGRALSLRMFFANEAYQSGGPLKHVVHAGQAVDGDVRGGAAKIDNDQKNSQSEKKKEIEKTLQGIKEKREINMTATEQPGADQNALQAERDELTQQFGLLSDEVSELDKSIKELEDKIQVAIAKEREKRRAELTQDECLDSFNEQLGDFLKDLAHYGDADPGVAIIQSSKYLDRLLDAASLISDRGLVKDQALTKELETQVGRMKVVQDQLIKARKGQIKMVPEEGGEPFTPDQELEQRRALACKIMSDWGINSLSSLHRCYAELGKKMNIEVRKNMATEV